MQDKNLMFSLEAVGGAAGVLVTLALLTVAMPVALVFSLFSGKSWDDFWGGIIPGLTDINIDL